MSRKRAEFFVYNYPVRNLTVFLDTNSVDDFLSDSIQSRCEIYTCEEVFVELLHRAANLHPATSERLDNFSAFFEKLYNSNIKVVRGIKDTARKHLYLNSSPNRRFNGEKIKSRELFELNTAKIDTIDLKKEYPFELISELRYGRNKQSRDARQLSKNIKESHRNKLILPVKKIKKIANSPTSGIDVKYELQRTLSGKFSNSDFDLFYSAVSEKFAESQARIPNWPWFKDAAKIFAIGARYHVQPNNRATTSDFADFAIISQFNRSPANTFVTDDERLLQLCSNLKEHGLLVDRFFVPTRRIRY